MVRDMARAGTRAASVIERTLELGSPGFESQLPHVSLAPWGKSLNPLPLLISGQDNCSSGSANKVLDRK